MECTILMILLSSPQVKAFLLIKFLLKLLIRGLP
jgi:hypothetical protein